MSDIGDSDDNDPAAFVIRVRVRFGEDGIVMIACIHGVDGEKRDVAEVLALSEFDLLGRLGLGDCRRRELIWNAVSMEGDQANGLLGFRIA